MLCLPYLFLLPALFWAVVASPINMQQRDVSTSVFTKLNYMEQFAAAAYCTPDDAAAVDVEVVCSAGNCPLVTAAVVPILFSFLNVGNEGTSGFVAVDETNELIVMSFRGTSTDENRIADIEFVLVDTPICQGCQVHYGFLDSWAAVADMVEQTLEEAMETYPGYEIIATGHSLGGAIATVAAADLREIGIDVSLYPYGSPMTGNLAFASFVTNQASQTFRVTHQSDLVPKLPSELLGYYHVAPEYFISSADNVVVTASAVTEYTGLQIWPDYRGNLATLGVSIAEHRWYFNAISACS